MRRRLQNFCGAGAGESWLFFCNRRLDFFSSKNERDEYSFAALAILIGGRCVLRRFISRQSGKACESVAAIDELFYV
jgi:hypothetical protein